MKVSFSAIIEAVSAGLLIGSSAIMYFLGPSFFIILLYSLTPVNTREYLYNTYPPDGLFVPNAPLALTFVMAMVGLFLASGVWTSYPNTKPIIVAITLGLWGWLVYFLMSKFPLPF
jgi:hypothetical protein